MKKPRHLSSEEKALWQSVASKVTPARPQKSKTQKVTEPPIKANSKAKILPNPKFRIGENAPLESATSFSAGPIVSPLKMDAKSFGNLKRGKLKPEATLDLHGMTVAQAHPELNRFILNAYGKQKRLVLVITGKSRAQSDTRIFGEQRGVLRRQVPHWLTLAPLSSVVLQVQPANIKHGGDGALYVYLKRSR